MDLRMTYRNHLGEVASVADGGTLHLMATDLLSHSWAFETDGQRVRKLRLDARTATLRLGMFGGSAAERDRLYRVLEADVLAATCGTLEFHGYSLTCLPVAASLDAWWFDEGIEEREVALLVPRPMWCRDVTHQFVPEDDDTSVDLDYAYDYAHDWKRGHAGDTLEVDTIGEAEFRLVVYGQADSPGVTIAGNTYKVNVTVADGSRLELDTRDKTIVVVDGQGSVTNAFDARERGRRGEGSYAFQPLPRGLLEVDSPGTFGFDVIVHDERTEPAWDA